VGCRLSILDAPLFDQLKPIVAILTEMNSPLAKVVVRI
jgi:hypothetical protein